MTIDFESVDYSGLEARVLAEQSPTKGELQLIYSPKHPGDVFVKVKGSKAAFICKFYGNNEAISALQALANVNYFMECWSGYAKMKAEIESLKVDLEKARRESAVLINPKDLVDPHLFVPLIESDEQSLDAREQMDRDAGGEKNGCQHLNLYPSMNLQMKIANCGHFLMHGNWQCLDCNEWLFLELEDEWDGREGVKTKDGKYQHRRIAGKNKIINVEAEQASKGDDE